MAGVSATVFSHVLAPSGKFAAMICVAEVPGANAVPSAVSRRLQMRCGRHSGAHGFPSLFQIRYGVPSSSTKGCGSMEPTGSESHWNGTDELSTYGPSGLDEVATPMQKRSGLVEVRIE